MKQIFYCFLFSVFSLCSYAQTNKVVIGTIDSLKSKILNEQRKVWVYVPEGGPNDIYARQKYPVVYLLDGDAHFFSVVGMIDQLSSANGNSIFPKMIVVGILNTDRTRDLTPSHVNGDSFINAEFSKTSGGGEKFISFIEKELMPRIDSKYPTQPYRMLIGHSFGGLAVMNTLIQRPDLFNSYVAIEPSMWWDQKKLLNEAKQTLAKGNYTNKSLFLAIANTMNTGMDTLSVQQDTSAGSRHIRSILELNKLISLNRQNKLRYGNKYYGDDGHISVPLIAAYDALHFVFRSYPLNLSQNDLENINKALIARVEQHYDRLSGEFGFKTKVPEDVANELGYRAMAAKHYEEAEYLFKLNITNYPESGNVYDSLGDLYEEKGEKKKAIDQFKKALAIKDVVQTRKKLEKLQGE